MKYITQQASLIENAEVKWSAIENALQYALKIDSEGTIPVKVDYYGTGGSGRAAILGDVSIKGIGKTLLVDESKGDAYSTGIQNESCSVIETAGLMAMHHLVGGIKPLGVIVPNGKVKVKIAGRVVEVDTKQASSILLRETPNRLMHYFLENENANETILYREIKRIHGLHTDNHLEIAKYFLMVCIYKRVFVDMLRFQLTDYSPDNVDLSGAAFDLPTSGFSAGFTNAVFTIDGATKEDALMSFARQVLELFKGQACKGIDSAIVNEHLTGSDGDLEVQNVALKKMIRDARIKFAPMLLGLSRIDTDILRQTDDRLEQRMAILVDFLFSDSTEMYHEEYLVDNTNLGTALPSLVKMLQGEQWIMSGEERVLLGEIKPIIDNLDENQKARALHILGKRVTTFGADYFKNTLGATDAIRTSLLVGESTDMKTLLEECEADVKTLPNFYEYFRNTDLYGEVFMTKELAERYELETQDRLHENAKMKTRARLDDDFEEYFKGIAVDENWTGEEVFDTLDWMKDSSAFIFKTSKYIDDYNIKTVLDVPCASANLLDNMYNFDEIKYIGIDATPKTIQRARMWTSQHENAKVTLADARTAKLPKSDLVICRHLMSHLPSGDNINILKRFLESGSQYILLSHHQGCKINSELDTPSVVPRDLNLHIAPYNLGEGIETFRDNRKSSTKNILTLFHRSDIEHLL